MRKFRTTGENIFDIFIAIFKVFSVKSSHLENTHKNQRCRIFF